MTPTGRLIDLDGERAWQIDGLEALPPFLISVVSAGDHWLFVSTAGALTAGRVDAARALFPYETDDRLHAAGGITGPITLIRAASGALWQPFDDRGLAPGRHRRLRKGEMGNWVEFEEEAPDLGLVFRYRWMTSERFGLVRRATLVGHGRVELLDGLVNLMPADVPPSAQQGLSALVDAYKRHERVGDTLALYALDAHLSDRAAPAEALRANTVWRRGLPGAAVCLSAAAIRDFRDGRPTPPHDVALGVRGAYLTRGTLDLTGAPVTWDLVGDVHLDHVALTALAHRMGDPGLGDALDADLAAGARALRANVASADGLQHTADTVACVHHFANVVFNNLRGGVFADDHRVPVADLDAFVATRNRPVHAAHAAWLAALPDRLDHAALIERAEATGDAQLVRLCLEYLPLTFGRRHGDPSRPWNSFTIRLRRPDGGLLYAYEGNWRDVFQNWEALARSFPRFLLPMIAKFVNATTRDGFNPYRLNQDGIDWERPNPEDPWSNLGYWGDHQIVYLFRLLEAAEAHFPGLLADWLGRDRFSYADVPYRVRPYADLVRDPKDTIVFDAAADHASTRRVAAMGTDGRLVLDADGRVRHVNLLEKLLVTVLAKLSNFVVDGGIWMNTQRPEWNDANNALVGPGLSVVTLAQLRRALRFLAPHARAAGRLPVTAAVATWFDDVRRALADERPALDAARGQVDPAIRRRLLDRLGEAFGAYREVVYGGDGGDRRPVDGADVAALCDLAGGWLDHTLRTNRRPDGLYHSYNLLALAPGAATITRLYEMLEGQVAVLSSGLLRPEEAVGVIDAMFASRLYRPDQASFLLYPNRERPRFLDRNRLGADVVARTPLLAALVAAGDRRILAEDADHTFRFDASLSNAEALAAALDALARDPAWTAAVAAGRDAVAAVYEDVFQHHAFTGRSGTMFKYEGLGSIYWHMVSKLLLAVQEVFDDAVDTGAPGPVVAALGERYYRVRRGLSFNKDVAEYGAVPSDPYSHTPAHLGAQQPGMTGQVKEEILTRLGELGVRVRDGALSFEPRLLRRRELLPAPATWAVVRSGGRDEALDVPAGAVAFTIAQTPVVLVVRDGPPAIEVTDADGPPVAADGRRLDRATTSRVLGRASRLVVRVGVPPDDLLGE